MVEGTGESSVTGTTVDAGEIVAAAGMEVNGEAETEAIVDGEAVTGAIIEGETVLTVAIADVTIYEPD